MIITIHLQKTFIINLADRSEFGVAQVIMRRLKENENVEDEDEIVLDKETIRDVVEELLEDSIDNLLDLVGEINETDFHIEVTDGPTPILAEAVTEGDGAHQTAESTEEA